MPHRTPSLLHAEQQVAAWDFRRIIPCHLESPIATTPRAFRAAFDFLEAPSTPRSSPWDLFKPSPPKLVKKDLMALEDAEVALIKAGSLYER